MLLFQGDRRTEAGFKRVVRKNLINLLDSFTIAEKGEEALGSPLISRPLTQPLSFNTHVSLLVEDCQKLLDCQDLHLKAGKKNLLRMIESKINAPFFGDCFMTHSRTLLHVIAMVQLGVVVYLLAQKKVPLLTYQSFIIIGSIYPCCLMPVLSANLTYTLHQFGITLVVFCV